VPVEGLAFEFTAFEIWEEIDAIDGAFEFTASGFDEGGEEVGAHDGGGADGAGLSEARPFDDEGLADAAFVDPSFATTEGEVGGG